MSEPTMTQLSGPTTARRRGPERADLALAVMYVLSLAAELPAALVRVILIDLGGHVVLSILGHDTDLLDWVAGAAGVGPLLFSILALVWPRGGWLWRQQEGGREASSRERLQYGDAIALLQADSVAPLPMPRALFVLDAAPFNAAVMGDTLMVNSQTLWDPHLPAVLAHELGHLRYLDARVALALSRLLVFAPYTEPVRDPYAPPAGCVGTLFAPVRWVFRFARGGTAMRVLGPLWAGQWRACEYRADRYAACLGQGDELADALELHVLMYDQPVPMLWLSEHTHPPTELRLDRLRALAVDYEPSMTVDDAVAIVGAEEEAAIHEVDPTADPSGLEVPPPNDPPSQEWRHGVVRWWKPEKGYGRITGDDGYVYFAHHSHLENANALAKGQRVRFKWRGVTAAHGRASVECIQPLSAVLSPDK
jgi:Zn-dependent protease with chaperone function/cold shock CspA family protein